MSVCTPLTVLLGLLVGQSIATNNALLFPEVEEYSTCRGSRMHKLMFNQTGYIQFVHYDVIVPDLRSFHTCFWFNLIDPRKAATFVSYARDFEAEANLLTIQWTGGSLPRWTLEINDETIADHRASRVRANTWHHACFSWKGTNDEYGIFQDGELLAIDAHYKHKNTVIRGGGILTSGQHQENRGNGMDQGEGMEGWFTLFNFHTQPLSNVNSAETKRFVAQLSKDCSATSRGDLVDWLHSPRKGYGGVAEMPAREDCHNF